MRFTEKLILGLACSALMFSLCGCGDSDSGSGSGSAIDRMDKVYNLSTVTNSQTPVALLSVGAGEEISSEYKAELASNVTPSRDYAEKAVRNSKRDAVKKNVTDRCLTGMLADQIKDVSAKVRVNAKTSGTAVLAKTNTTYADTEKGGDVTIYMAKNLTGHATKTFRKILANDETKSTLIFAEVVNGEPCFTEEQALAVDEVFGTENPYNPDGTPIGTAVREQFGSEFAPGRDGTEKIIIMMCSSDTIGSTVYGYFAPGDEYSKSDYQYSNEGEILYMNSTLSEFDMFSTMAHEFQHMCNFNQKVALDGSFTGQQEVTFINEGQSTLSEDLNGFGLDVPDSKEGGNSFLFTSASSYMENPSGTPIEASFGNSSAEYGEAYLMMRYIADRFGTSTIKSIATSPKVDIENIGDATGMPFKEFFKDFGIANAVSNLSGTPDKYNYKGISLAESYNCGSKSGSLGWASSEYPESTRDSYTVQPWTNNYFTYAYDGSKNNVKIGIDGPDDISSFALMLLRGNIVDKIM